MSNKIQLNIYDIVGGSIWVSTDDGQKVYEKILQAFQADRSVQLSFARRGNLISAFLNAAIGQLYNGNFTEDFLDNHLSYCDINNEDQETVRRAVENAKRYFANRQQYDNVWKEEMGDEEE